jgi:hypothetical protein
LVAAHEPTTRAACSPRAMAAIGVKRSGLDETKKRNIIGFHA